MFKPLPLEALAGEDMVPQAVIKRPTAKFAADLQLQFTHGHDDLDVYDAAAIVVETGRVTVVVELKHQPGYPKGTTTVYLPSKIEGVAKITEMLGIIADELNIPQNLFVWQRSDNPDL